LLYTADFKDSMLAIAVTTRDEPEWAPHRQLCLYLYIWYVVL